MYHLLQLSEMFHMNSICKKFLQRVSTVNLSGSGGVGRANNRKKKNSKVGDEASFNLELWKI